MQTGESVLPFNCLFYNEDDESCKIYELRPLFCRAYGAALFPSPLLMSKAYAKQGRFLLIKSKQDGRIIIRRPAPIFCFFSLVFDGEVPEKIPEISFCSDIMRLDEDEYIKKLIEITN